MGAVLSGGWLCCRRQTDSQGVVLFPSHANAQDCLWVQGGWGWAQGAGSTEHSQCPPSLGMARTQFMGLVVPRRG